MKTELDYWRELTAAGSVIRPTPDEVLWEGTVPAGKDWAQVFWRACGKKTDSQAATDNYVAPGDTLRLVRVRRATTAPEPVWIDG